MATHAASKHALRQSEGHTKMQEIKDAPCGKPNAYPAAGLVLEMERGDPIRQPGVRIICSERLCGLHDGANAIVVSLEGVRSIRTELPEGCPPAPAGSPAQGR
jgi:hypothetical protein